MNDLDRLPYLTPDQRRWMADQLSQHRPHAQIVVDFIDTFPDFGAGQPFSVHRQDYPITDQEHDAKRQGTG